MKAIILVGGEGLRLRPLTCNVPKPMVPIVNKPFLEHMIDNLKRHDIHEIILAICYLSEHIQQHFGDGSDFGVKMTCAFENTPLGTGGAIKNAEAFLDGPFVVCNGDIFTDLDLTAMIKSHREYGAKATIALTPVEDPTAYGVVETDAKNGVKAFVEKPSLDRVTSNLINAGTYVLEPEVLDFIPSGVHHMVERGLFPDMVEQGLPFLGYPSNAYWIDIGRPVDYFQLHHDILMGKAIARFPGKSVADDIWVEENSDIHPSAKIIGPVVIGRECSIEQDVRISGPAVIGDNCIITQRARIDESIIWNDAQIGKDATIVNSIVGKGSFIGDNTRITDGSIVGDNASIGRSNRLKHEIKIWPDTTIGDNAISF